MQALLIGAAVVVMVSVPAVALWRTIRNRRTFESMEDRVTFAVLHQANEAASELRAGFTSQTAGRAAEHLLRLLGSKALVMTDAARLLVWEGDGAHHADQAERIGAAVVESGRLQVVGGGDLGCGHDCPIRSGVVAPLIVDGAVIGTLGTYGTATTAGLIRATGEIARWVSTQLELAELDRSRARLAEAELKRLRAQISPHFVYNALTAIASFVRSDPERARELLLEFADFTRYSFRNQGQFTSLAEELRAIDTYLALERARFGDRLDISVRVAPEVLPVVIPFLTLQPLVENAVRHGLEGQSGPGRVAIIADDDGSDCVISIEDNGAGMDPAWLERYLAGDRDSGSVGLANVDERLRNVFGPAHGLVVETALGAGTKVTMRIPKFRSGVRVG
jgi:two-component system, LytTR family, sensor kinase